MEEDKEGWPIVKPTFVSGYRQKDVSSDVRLITSTCCPFLKILFTNSHCFFFQFLATCVDGLGTTVLSAQKGIKKQTQQIRKLILLIITSMHP